MTVKSNGTKIPEVSDQFRIIQRFALSLLRQNSLDDLTWDIATNAGQVLGFEDCVVYLRKGDILVQHAAYGLKNPSGRKILNPIQIPIGQGIVGTVAATQIGEIVPDTRADPRYIFDEFSGKSEITVPIIYEGRTIGVLDSESSRPDNFSALDFALFRSVADIASSRIASAINEDKLRQSQHKLIKYQQELESKVVERTHQISETLETVRSQESRLRQTQVELTRERDWLRGILESISDGIIATNELGTIQMISKSATQILGRSACRVGNRVQSVLAVETSDGSIYDNTGQLTEARVEGTIQTDDGLEKIIKCSVKSVNQKDMSELAFVISLQDVTLQTYLEAEAEKAQRLDSLGILAGGVAHDFNNHLAAITGLVGAAKLADRETQTEYLNLAEQACFRSKKLTDQLLTLSKGGVPSIQPCDIAQIVRDAQLLTSAGSSVKFDFRGQHDVPMVRADPGQMMQVFENIIINAQQAMKGAGRIEIELQTVDVDDQPMVQIDIQDDGPGIDPPTLSRIFDPYFTTKQTGHGLGLTTSYAIVQRHQGQLNVQSEIGQGSRFSITLPISSSTHNGQVQPNSPVRRTLEILVLEDDEFVRKSITALVRSLGHRITLAPTGGDAIDAFARRRQRNRQFDLAILDMTIVGGMGGYETMLELKKLDRALPIISMSGYTADAQFDATVEFDGYLQKPFTACQLQDVINQVREKQV